MTDNTKALEKPKPCPFCGSKRIMTIGVFQCADCCAIGPNTSATDIHIKTDAWNTRHDHPDYINKAELLERLRGMIIPEGGMKPACSRSALREEGFNQAINQIIEEILK